ncbi:MAG: hypothetical protein ABRQ26_08415 [Syntrophomonadaceae bacterium]
MPFSLSCCLIVHKANSKLDFIPPAIKTKPSHIVVGVILVLLGILGYGTWNTWHPVIRSYEINISKEVAGSKDLHVVLVSELPDRPYGSVPRPNWWI